MGLTITGNLSYGKTASNRSISRLAFLKGPGWWYVPSDSDYFNCLISDIFSLITYFRFSED